MAAFIYTKKGKLYLSPLQLSRAKKVKLTDGGKSYYGLVFRNSVVQGASSVKSKTNKSTIKKTTSCAMKIAAIRKILK